jgi:3-hydroxyacyl-CoA dehydrogenase
MSRAWQIERAMERAEEQLSRDLNEGRISQTDYNAEMRELQRDARAAYEEDMRDAQERVRDEWGY